MVDSQYYNQAHLLLRILPFIFKHQEFSLKGGTGINFFYRSLPRLSVNIDLTYLPIQSRRETLDNIDHLLKNLKSNIENKVPGTRVIAQSNKNRVVKLIVRTNQATTKIEPNFVIRGSLYSIESKKLVNKAVKLFEVSVKSRVLSFADLYGGKICAALDRQHPRDLFDIKLLLENEGITNDIKNAFIFYLISHDRPMLELLNPNLLDIKELYNKSFKGMTSVDVSEKELIETRKILINKINNILSDKDKKFLLSINSGKPKWELFPYPKIKRFHSVTWKLANINKLKELNYDKYLKTNCKLKNYFDG